MTFKETDTLFSDYELDYIRSLLVGDYMDLLAKHSSSDFRCRFVKSMFDRLSDFLDFRNFNYSVARDEYLERFK